MKTMDQDLESAETRLRGLLRDMGSVLVAYSGGVDSALLLKVAADELGEKARAAIGISPSLTAEELAGARETARAMGVNLIEMKTGEFDLPEYLANPCDRCYYCKRDLFSRLIDLARREGVSWVADGFQLDDKRDVRPGFRAGGEAGIRHPLGEAGFDKERTRALARRLGLGVWDKPAAPCLSSRVAFGLELSPALMNQVAAAERAVRDLFPEARDLRVRHLGEEARVELDAERVAEALSREEEIREKLAALGYRRVTVSREGYRQGSLSRPASPG